MLVVYTLDSSIITYNNSLLASYMSTVMFCDHQFNIVATSVVLCFQSNFCYAPLVCYIMFHSGLLPICGSEEL